MFKIWHNEFSIAGGAAETPRRPLRLPAGPAAFPDILPAVRDLADAMVERACADLASIGRPVTCGPGCEACCSHLVVVGEAEALRLARTVHALPEAHRARVEERFRLGLDRLEQSGLLPRLVGVFGRQAHDWRLVSEMQRAYWELSIPCPFLERGNCSIYEERPLICRQYLMSTPPAACADPYGPQAYLEKVVPPLDLAGAAAAFDGAGAAASRVLPHLLCLFRESALRRRVYPVKDPHAMLLRFLDLAALGYARKN